MHTDWAVLVRAVEEGGDGAGARNPHAFPQPGEEGAFPGALRGVRPVEGVQHQRVAPPAELGDQAAVVAVEGAVRRAGQPRAGHGLLVAVDEELDVDREDAGGGRTSLRLWWVEDAFQFATPDFGFASTALGRALGGEAQRVARLAGGVLTWGLEWHQATFTYADTFSGFEGTGTTAAAYAHYDAELSPRTLVGAGARIEHHSVYGTQITPRAGAVHFIRPDLRLRAAVGLTSRPPTFGELFFPGCSNPDLRPERAWTADLGVEGVGERLVTRFLAVWDSPAGAAGAVAGMIGRLNPQDSPTFKLVPLFGIPAATYRESQLNRLLGPTTNLLVVQQRTGRGVVVLRGLDASGDQISVTRVADMAIRETKAISENFIGRLNTEDARTALRQQIVATFTRMERDGAGYTARIRRGAVTVGQLGGQQVIDHRRHNRPRQQIRRQHGKRHGQRERRDGESHQNHVLPQRELDGDFDDGSGEPQKQIDAMDGLVHQRAAAIERNKCCAGCACCSR